MDISSLLTSECDHSVLIVSRMISWLCFLIYSLASFFMVLHIYVYSIRCLSSPFRTITRHFVTKVRVSDDVLALFFK